MSLLKRNYPWCLLVLLLAVASFLTVRNKLLIRELDEEFVSLQKRASELGMDKSMLTRPPEKIPTKYSQRSVVTDKLHYPKTASGVIEMALLIQQMGYDGKPDDLRTKKLELALNEALLGMSPKQIAELIGLLRDQTSLEKQTREKIAGDAMRYLKDRDFHAFMEICVGPPNPALPDYLFENLFFNWGIKEPEAAIAWIKKNRESRKDLINQSAIGSVIIGAGDTRPAWAFELIKEFGIENDWLIAESMIGRAETDERRSAMLASLRDYIDGMEDRGQIDYFKERAYRQFVYSMQGHGIDETMAWLDQAGFSQDELKHVASGLDYNTVKQNHQQWFEWLDRNLPDDQRNRHLERMVRGWTQYDFMAAGEWLASAPDGGWMKSVGLPAYVRAVAPVDPVNAEAWAVTVAGEERQSLLQEIYNSWPREGVQGKDAFARKYGINTDK